VVTNKLTELGQKFCANVLEHAIEVRPSTHDAEIRFISTADFLEQDFNHTWLVQDAVAHGQPLFIGGTKKALKTSISIDLAVSIATGRPFLNYKKFKVSTSRSVGVVSGESGEPTVKETFQRICASKGIWDPGSVPIHWCWHMPQLSNQLQLKELGKKIQDLGVEVLILDPLYLGLLAGSKNKNASNLFDMGPLFAQVTHACQDAGAQTLIFVHHTHKHSDNARKLFDPPELEDLAFAGAQEFARQWMMIGRRAQFESGSGRHQLWMNIGGSAGHSGCYAIDIEEGIPGPDFSGRSWGVTVRTQSQEIEARKLNHAAAAEVKRVDQLEGDKQKVRDALEQSPDGDTLSGLRSKCSMSKERLSSALTALVKNGHVVEANVTKPGGKAKSREYGGYRLATLQQP